MRTRQHPTRRPAPPTADVITSPDGYRASDLARRPAVLLSVAIGLVAAHLRVATLVFGLWAVTSNLLTQFIAATHTNAAGGWDATTISAIGSVIASVATLITAAGAILTRGKRDATRRKLTRDERAELVRTLLEDLNEQDEIEARRIAGTGG